MTERQPPSDAPQARYAEIQQRCEHADSSCQALEAALGEIVDLSDRQVSPYRPLIALAEIYGRRLDAIRSIARRALAAGGERE